MRPGARVCEVAERYGVKLQQLTTWRRSARKGELALVADEAPDFVAIEVSEPVVPRKPAPIVISIGRVSVRLDAEVPSARISTDRNRARSQHMIIPAQGLRILLTMHPVDFRCGHNALAGLVQNTLGLDPGLIVVFRSKRADRLKILLWDGTGLVLVYKRLGDGRFSGRASATAFYVSRALSSKRFLTD